MGGKPENTRFSACVDNVEYVDIKIKNRKIQAFFIFFSKRNPQIFFAKNKKKFVDYVDNYLPKSFSPTFTISPAPIVINKSPCVQFSKRKFSISSKEEK